jgi:uncharacterized protein (DUF2342 family)
VLESLFWKVTGLDLKLQQYERGERFARAIYDKYGMETLNRAWEGPEHLPRLDELDDPEEWQRRVSKLAKVSSTRSAGATRRQLPAKRGGAVSP